MNKRVILPALVTFFMMSGSSYAGFDKNPTSALEDRRATAEANKEQTKLLQDLLSETKKTNDLLKSLVDIYTGTNRAINGDMYGQGGGMGSSSEAGGAYGEGVNQEPQGGRRDRRR